MRIDATETEQTINEVFKDLERTLRNHRSEEITYHQSSFDQPAQAIEGSELFSRFTADIIKKETLFTR